MMRARVSMSAGLCAALLAVACSKPTALPAPPEDAGTKAILATLPAAYQNADLENGQSNLALCKACHTLNQGAQAAVGPNLWGVFGRKAGSQPGFHYSDGMKRLNVVWDADRLNTWITRPSAMVSGTRMSYIGMESAKDRIDLVAALKVATTAK
jgi:cytochrome c